MYRENSFFDTSYEKVEKGNEGKWCYSTFLFSAPGVVTITLKNVLRYSELRREMGNITDAVLASTLKSLIANGIVCRKSYDEIPPRVEYALSEKGKSVVPILQSICAWSGAFFKTDPTNEMIQCRKCDHK